MNRKQLLEFDMLVNEARNQLTAGNVSAAKVAFARTTALFNEVTSELPRETSPEPSPPKPAPQRPTMKPGPQIVDA